MDKIKSARELAMERTANIKSNQGEESGGFDRQQYIKAASVLARSYLEEKTELERVKEAIGRYPPAVSGEAKNAFLAEVIEQAKLEDCTRVLQSAELFRPDLQESEALKSLRALAERYREALDARLSYFAGEGQGELRASLKAEGIGGSAVAGMNPERSPRFSETLSAFTAQFSGELEQVKKQLSSQCRTLTM